MTPLRQRFIEDMQLRGYSARTQEAYTRAVRQLAERYHRSPDQLSEEQLRQYFLYLANEKKWARASTTIALCGIKFFYEQTLQRDWPTLRFFRPPREKKLPVILSRGEVRRILAEVRILVYRACLTTIYSCGLRLMEAYAFRWPMSIAPAWSCTSMAKGNETATYPCRRGHSRGCVSFGRPTVRHSGCFQRRHAAVRLGVWLTMPAR